MKTYAKRDKIFDCLIFLLFSFTPILSLINYLTNFIGWNTQADTIICYAFVFGLLLIFIFKNIKRLQNYFSIVFLSFFILIFSFLIHSNFVYFGNAMIDFAYFSIYFLMGFCIRCDDECSRILEKSAKFSIITLFIILIFDVFFNSNINTDHDMVTAYTMLTPVVFLLLQFFRKNHLTLLIYIVLGTLCLFLYGTRGPILALAVSFLISLYFFGKKWTKIIFTIAILSLLIFREPILNFLDSFLSQIGLGSTRIVDMLLNGTINDDNGRTALQSQAIEYIQKSPFIGLGLFGNMVKLGDYPHNMFLEILLQFGVPGGIIILVLFSFFFLKKLKSMDIFAKQFTVVLFAMIFTKLMVTGSYLSEHFLFFIVGMLVNEGKGIALSNTIHVSRNFKRCISYV